MNRITRVTRRDIFNTLIEDVEVYDFYAPQMKRFYPWGVLDEVEFLERLYNLEEMPSKDCRYKNAKEDIYAHAVINNDYSHGWVFYDERFPLKNGTDEQLLDFLCEMFHPEVRNEKGHWMNYMAKVESLLYNDGYTLFQNGTISGHPVYSWRDITKNNFTQITENDIDDFLRLYNRSGYVLNFSTPKFDEFTAKSIGLALCTHYGLSKGKSLEKYVYEASEANAIKLLCDLFDYYEREQEFEAERRNHSQFAFYYKRCVDIYKRLKNSSIAITEYASTLSHQFSSEYMSSQITLMLKMQKENPTEAIGKAKELVESCCKTILEERTVEINPDWKLNNHVDETVKLLHVTPKDIPNNIPEADAMRAILGSLKGIVTNIAKLRNSYGSGHGRSASYRGLEERHAKLAIGSCETLVDFLWASHIRTLEM